MAFNLRLPNIKGTDREQLAQIRSYLYQLAEELQIEFARIENSLSEQEKKNLKN